MYFKQVNSRWLRTYEKAQDGMKKIKYEVTDLKPVQEYHYIVASSFGLPFTCWTWQVFLTEHYCKKMKLQPDSSSLNFLNNDPKNFHPALKITDIFPSQSQYIRSFLCLQFGHLVKLMKTETQRGLEVLKISTCPFLRNTVP